MNTRSSQRRGGQKEDFGGVDETIYPLVRPSIRGPKKSTTKGDDGNKTKNSPEDKTTSSFGDSMTTEDNLSNNVASMPSANDSKRKVYDPKSSKSAPVKKSDREDGHNYSHSLNGSELNNDEENSEEELVHTSASNIRTSSSKDFFKSRPSDDHSQVEDHQPSPPNLRLRKDDKSASLNIKSSRSHELGDKEEFVCKQQIRKEKLLPNTKKRDAYSDDEEDQPQPQPVRGNHWILLFTVLALVLVIASLALWMLVLRKPPIPKEEKELQVLTAFQDRFRKLQMIFTGQSPDLWQRSQRILELQLRHGDENKEPAIILLTAAQDAEQMLHCVGDQLAKIYAFSLNSSYMALSGLETNSEDSEDVKMDIDRRLSAGFQANNKAAVLHRLELLPPGSLLILYKYCDHENAAFKNIALVLTVLLKNATLQPDMELNELEETVHDFLKDTFINQVKSRMPHNEMDGDKLGGLWSRISHVVLPVLPGKHPVKECGESQRSP